MPIITPSSGGVVGSGIGAVLFDSTLGADAAVIDTGPNGIAQTQNVLEAWLLGRVDDAAVSGTVLVTVNNDTGANYDLQRVSGINATAAATATLAQSNWALNMHGSGGTAGYASVTALTFPGYAQTTFFKTGEARGMALETVAANCQVTVNAIAYRQTTAISRLAVTPGAGSTVLKAGSRLLILGR